MLKHVSWKGRTNFLSVSLMQSVLLLGVFTLANGQMAPTTSAPDSLLIAPASALSGAPLADTASLYLATTPSSSIVPETLAAPIFPRIPGENLMSPMGSTLPAVNAGNNLDAEPF